MSKCQHGQEIGVQSAIEDIRSWEETGDEFSILEFYSACDCCDYLMHKSYANGDGEYGYQVLEDGRTLCFACREGRKK